MDSFLIILLGIVLAIAAANDFRFRKIPNLLTYPTMTAALAYHGMNGGFEGFLFSAKGLGLGMAILILPYLIGGMGAGDAKLMGAVGAILGPKGVFIAFLFTAIIGGIYAMTLLLAKPEHLRRFIKRWGTMPKTFVRIGQSTYIPTAKNQKKPRLCYGVAIALGTMCSIVWRLLGYTFPI